MTARSFNARNGLSVGTTPIEAVDINNNVTANSIAVGANVSINSTAVFVSGNTTRPDTTISRAGIYIGNTTSPYGSGGNIWLRSDSFTASLLAGSLEIDAYPLVDYDGVTIQSSSIAVGNTNGSGKSSTITANGITANAGTFSGNVTIGGNLTVSGTTTYINTTTLNIGDNIVTLNADLGSTTAPSENAGIEINRGNAANTALRWNETSDIWEVTNDGTNYGRIHSKLADVVLGTDTSGNYVASVSSGTTAISISGTAGEGWTPTVSIRSASTTQDGIVQLTDSTSSTSTTTAATPASVKSAYDLAASKGTGTVTSVATGSGLTGGTITGTGTISVVANNGIVANTTGVFVNAGNGLVANATGVHMTSVGTAGSSTGGISAITVDAQGRVTSVTGSAGYVTSSGVTSVATGSGLTGGTITGSGTLSVLAGTGIVANATGVHVNLTDSVSSTSTTTAATPNSVKTAYDLAASKGTGSVTSVATGNGLTGGSITTTGTISVVANNGIVANSTGVFVNAGNGLVANATGVHMASVATAGSSTGGISAITIDTQGRVTSVTGSAGYVTSSGVTSVATANGIGGGTITGTGSLYAVVGSTLVANATGIHMPNVATAGSSSSGISAITIDAQGRVTSVTGSAGYVTSSGVTSVATGNGLTGGTITTTGTLSVQAGTGIVANATGVHVSLTDSVSSTSTTTAATPNSVKTAYDLAASKGTGTVTSVGGTGTVNGITLTGTVTGSGNLTLGGSITAGSTTTAGIVQLTDSVSSTSTTTAATPNSVKTAYDLANGKAATNQTMYIGTTAVAINRGSAAITLTGTNIDGSAGSVAWTNVSGRPTAVSSFTNDSGYITSSSQSVNKYAALRYSYTYDYGTRYSPGTGFSYTASGTKNVSSLTWNGDGDITINFTSAFADANYKAFLQGPGDGTHAMTGIKSQTTTSCRATTKYTANSTGGQFFINPGYTHNFVALEFA